MVDWKQVDRENYWHAFTQMAEYEPLIIERAEGVWLYDTQGNKLLDGASSMWCNVHGHRHPAIDAAIREQLDKVAHVTSLGMSNPTTIELTAKLVDTAPTGLECAFYSSDGASAVEVALKLAFQYWRQVEQPQFQRDLYLAVGNAYHGDTLGAVSVGGVARFHAMFAPLLFDVVRGPCPDSYHVPDNVPADALCEHYLDEYRKLFQQFGHRLAAVIVEPLIQGAAGMVMHPPGFLSGLAKLAKEYGSLLIADEIATGVGRTGKMWACEWESVTPDFLVTGKGLSGGYLPMAATLTTRQIWNAFLGEYSQSRSFFHGHTYGGNPLGSAAALATLKLFDNEGTLQKVQQQSAYLQERLSVLESHPRVGDVRVKGLVGGVELVASRETKESFPWHQRIGHQVCQRMISAGVWTRPLGNVIVLMPPLCIKQSEIDFMVDALESAIQLQFAQ
jgi:adenosylmethionine---8-amino-7-oxononanoate aminotransferase